MDEKLLLGALGGLVATIVNVLYNYTREAINRRWQVATEVAGTLDYYYERVVRLVAHQEGMHQEKTPMLTQEELRTLGFEVAPVLVDAQQVKTRLALVFGEDSQELAQYDEILTLMKTTIDDGLSATRSGWVVEGPELRKRINDINTKRNRFGSSS